ncbi:MAG: hypothetical protein KF797_12155 [Flavobacteriales bacterium]|nr:hypothetical protein [Flavobacteriales bacterium]
MPTCAYAQATGTVRMLIDPGHDFQFVVDRKYRMQQREVTLGEGLHHFSVWAPERTIVDTNVFVVGGRSAELVMRLPYSAEYVAYRDAYVRYQNARKLRVVPPVVFAAGALWAGLSYGAYTKAHDQLQADREAYAVATDPGRIANLKNELIPEHKADFKRARTSLILGSSLAAVGAGAFWYIRHRTKGLSAPTFEDKERIRFEGLTWIDTRRGGVFAAAVSIPLAR